MSPRNLAVSDCRTDRVSPDRWYSACVYLDTEIPLLDSLQRDKSGIPSLVAELEKAATFRADKNERLRESSTTMQSRAEAVKDWLRIGKLGTVLAPTAERKFFQHFVVDKGHGSASTSVLFRHFVHELRNKEPNKEFNDVTAFTSMLGEVRSLLSRFLKLQEPGLSFVELMEIGTVLKTEVRAPETELRILANFYSPSTGLNSAASRQLTIVLQLCGLKKPLSALMLACNPKDTRLPGVFERFSFGCSTHDGDAEYLALKQLASNLCDPQMTSSWDDAECAQRLQQAHQLIYPTDGETSSINHNALLGMLCLFEQLGASEKVWEFVHSHNEVYVSSAGDGYTSAFDFKIEDLLLGLGGEDYKVVENFKPVVCWISILVANRDKSFRDLMHALWHSNTITTQAEQPLENGGGPFSQISTANEYMDFLNDLFRNGHGGLDKVLPQFQSVGACCIYIFDLKACQLTLAYVDERKKDWTILNPDEVLDFEQRLGFVQHEEKAQEYEILPFLNKLQEFRRALAIMCELFALGSPQFSTPMCTLMSFAKPISGPLKRKIPAAACTTSDQAKLRQDQLELTSLEQIRDGWKEELSRVLEKNKWLCLFSSLGAQRMADLIKAKSSYDLAFMLVPLFPQMKDNAQLLPLLKDQIDAACETAATASTAVTWPMRTSEFLENVMGRMSSHDITSVVESAPGSDFGHDNGPIRYSAAPLHSSMLRLLLYIYGGRVPEPFEILWCGKDTTQRMLRAFLERAKHYSHRRFVLLQVELIAHELQHVLLRLFLDSRDAKPGQLRAGHNVHCIETAPCALQSAAWIKLVSADEVCEGVNLKLMLPRYAVGTEVTCYYGATGMGKTYQMRKAMGRIGTMAVTCVLSITEAFSLGEAVRKLHKKALLSGSTGRPLALRVHINVGKFKRSEHAQWRALMERVSKFFFRLLVLRSVEDPHSDLVFNLPPGCELKVLVEIPDRDGHLEPQLGEEALTAASRMARDHKLFAEELPVLDALGKLVDAARLPFDIGDEAMHVCKYLKAYDLPSGSEGSIDQQYGGGRGGPKVRLLSVAALDLGTDHLACNSVSGCGVCAR